MAEPGNRSTANLADAAVNITVTFARTGNCETLFVLTDGSALNIFTSGDLNFPGGLSVDHVTFFNPGSVTCDDSVQMVGY